MAKWRGNVILGRQDLESPAALTESALARLRDLDIRWVTGTATVWMVTKGDLLLGYVTRRLGGECFRRPEDAPGAWRWAIDRWNPADPVHAHATICLLDNLEE